MKFVLAAAGRNLKSVVLIDNVYPKLLAWKGTIPDQWMKIVVKLNSLAIEQRFESSDVSLLNGEIHLEFRLGVVCLKFSIGENITYIQEGRAQILDFTEAYGLIVRIMGEIIKI